jgi:hypothetical protein
MKIMTQELLHNIFYRLDLFLKVINWI